MKLPDQARKLLDGRNFASVATLMRDGSPQVTPVWVDREGDVVVINATMKRQKYKNLKRDPRVALDVFDQSNPYSKVVIRGKVVEMTKEGAEAHIDKLSMKYNNNPKYPNHSLGEPRVIIRIEPLSVTK
ncbi:MAG: PPOX class F420-dependent oxidoreductase [Nitrososphaerales archaeon]